MAVKKLFTVLPRCAVDKIIIVIVPAEGVLRTCGTVPKLSVAFVGSSVYPPDMLFSAPRRLQYLASNFILTPNGDPLLSLFSLPIPR